MAIKKLSSEASRPELKRATQRTFGSTSQILSRYYKGKGILLLSPICTRLVRI